MRIVGKPCAIAPRGLGLIERLVSKPHQRPDPRHARGCNGNPNAYAEGDVVATPNFAPTFVTDSFPQAFSYRARLFWAGFRQQNGKLITTNARCHVRRAFALTAQLSNPSNSPITGFMALAIVDLLEVVNVDKN